MALDALWGFFSFMGRVRKQPQWQQTLPMLSH